MVQPYAIDDRYDINILPADDLQRRFAEKAMAVWQGLPQPDRDLLVAFWMGVRFSGRPRRDAPVFWFDEDIAGGVAGETVDGYELHFSVRLLARMPDDVMLVTIAHELGHSLLHAKGYHWGRRSRSQVEAAVDDIVSGWGYKPNIARDWLNATASADRAGHPPGVGES